jgi:transposase
MRQKSNSTPVTSEKLVRNIRGATRKPHAAEEKIRIVLDGSSIAELCRREGIAESMYYSWSKEFLEAGWGKPNMRLSASEKLEIIRLVEQSHLPARWTLEMLGSSQRRSIVGITRSDRAGQRPSKTSHRNPIGSGTAFPTPFARTSSRWRLSSRNSADASCGSPTDDLISQPSLHRHQGR